MSVVAVRPVVTRIGDELFNRLQRLAAGSSPYAAVYEVVRPTRLSDYTPRHLQIVLTKESEEEVPELMCPGNPPALAFKQTYAIRCHVLPSEKDPTPVDEYCEVFRAEVVKAVCEFTRWETFGGLALLADWLGTGDTDSDGGIDGVTVRLAITYRVDEGNPYNVRA